jgi:glycosyltransferase involved in cell wall biosynthesis
MSEFRKPVRLAYVVPTKDRREDLRKLLITIARQTLQPDQVVVVDASDPPIRDLVDEFPELAITYVREFPPSLARQRNAGMAAIADSITVAGYIDDDIELADNATERMAAFWASAEPEVGGAAFTIVNQPQPHVLFGILSRFFLLNSSRVGAVLPSGFGAAIFPQESNVRTEWLYGGATMWKREVIAKFSYDEWYLGHGYLEDLDYSYRVSRQYELWLVADAKLWHWPRPIRIERNVDMGRQQIVNRLYFVRKMGRFNPVLVTYSLFGLAIRNLLEPIKERNRAGLLQLWGNLLGLRDIAKHGLRSVNAVWK